MTARPLLRPDDSALPATADRPHRTPPGPSRWLPAGPRRPLLWLGVIVAVAMAIRLPLLNGPMVDYDEGVYWQSLRSMAGGHPLFSAVYSSQPPFFLAALLPFFSLLGHSIVAARAGVLVFLAAGIVFAYLIGRTLATPAVGLIAAALVSLDPLLMRQSVTLQAEGPAAALALGAVALAAMAPARRGRVATMLAAGAGALLALGVLTKLLDAAAAAPVAMLVVGTMPAGTRKVAAVARRLAPTAAGFVVAAAAVLVPFGSHLGDVVDQSVGLHLASQGVHEGGYSPDMQSVLVRELPLVLLAVAGFALWMRHAPPLAAACAGWAVATAVLLTGVHPLWPHHLALLMPAVLLAASPVVAAAAVPVMRPAGPLALPVTAALCLSLGLLSWRTNPYRATDGASASSAQVAEIMALTRSGDVIAGDDQYATASADRDAPPELVDTALVRILSGSLTTGAAEDAIVRSGARGVLLATGRLDHLPGFPQWVATMFPHRVDLGGGRILSLRDQR